MRNIKQITKENITIIINNIREYINNNLTLHRQTALANYCYQFQDMFS